MNHTLIILPIAWYPIIAMFMVIFYYHIYFSCSPVICTHHSRQQSQIDHYSASVLRLNFTIKRIVKLIN